MLVYEWHLARNNENDSTTRDGSLWHWAKKIIMKSYFNVLFRGSYECIRGFCSLLSCSHNCILSNTSVCTTVIVQHSSTRWQQHTTITMGFNNGFTMNKYICAITERLVTWYRNMSQVILMYLIYSYNYVTVISLLLLCDLMCHL